MSRCPADDPQSAHTASADAATVRLWRHELSLRSGERPVQSASTFDIAFATSGAAQPPPTVPGYDILGELGRGGMGVVFKARQVRLNRLVALKMIHADELADPDTLARFRTEVEAVARLQHPNIVQIYEVGEAEGRPFFSLEYVGGGSLAQRTGGQPQPPGEAAAVVEILARAVHYAHSQGVIHRDLKPGNILLGSDAGSPKVADFGLAKYPKPASGSADSPSRRGLVVGTPQYMAPESCTSPATVGPVADVYALGAILYELLTGRPPFSGANAVDTLLQVRLADPLPPRAWQPKTPRDLETIALKCLAKVPRDRYPSARELAEDLRRFQGGVPIRARPASLTERAWKATRRHPAVAILSVTAAAACLAVFGAMTWRWRLAEQGRATATAALAASEDRLVQAEQTLYLSRIAQVHEHVRAGRFAPAARLLRQCLPNESRPDHRGWEWHYLQRFCECGRDPVSAQEMMDSGFRNFAPEAVSPDGRRLAAVNADGLVVLRDAVTGEEVLTLKAGQAAAAKLAFSDDGLQLIVVRAEGAIVWDAGPPRNR